MRILLTGARGFLGLRIAQAVPVMAAPSLRNASLEDVRRLMDETEPDVVMHTAAIAEMGVCERDPEASRQANVLLPEFIARAGKGAKLVMLSTDQVYNGCPGDGPYRESEALPANVYARHKLEMEQRVLEIAPESVMLRATWMYDMPLFGAQNRGNFLVNVMNAAMRGEKIAFPQGQMRGVTWAREMAQKMMEAAALPGGVYNFGSGSSLTMPELARFLAQKMGLQAEISEGERRHNLLMDGEKLRGEGISFRSSAEGLLDCLRAYGLEK